MRSKPFRQKRWRSCRDSSSLTDQPWKVLFSEHGAESEILRLRCFVTFKIRRKVMFEGLLQPTHLLVIFGIALLVFGPKKLPELGKGIGEGIRGFKSAMKVHEDASDKTTIAAHVSSPRVRSFIAPD